MKTSRQRLLDTIRAQRVVSAGDLSRTLHMTPANARHHLSILVEQGLVEVVGQRPAPGKGRPVQLYGLSNRALGDNLGGLAHAVLAELQDGLPENDRQQALQRIAARMAAPLGENEPPPGENLPRQAASHSAPALARRLLSTVQHLNQMGYQARWEAHAGAPHLILGRCPYAAILPEHPELCRLDAALLEQLTGATARQVERLALDARGLPYCLFHILQATP